jgi:hypothetical protein
MVRQVLFGLFVVASAISQAAEPKKLVLACEGYTHYLGAESQPVPVSLRINVNLVDRTVEGFRYPENFPIRITDINERTIVFHGSSRPAPGATYRQINGGIDRMTGEAEATSDVTNLRESNASAIHSRKCTPPESWFPATRQTIQVPGEAYLKHT